MSLRKVTDDKDGHQEIGRYENIRITVGYSRSIRAFYVKLTDCADGVESVLLTDRSSSFNLRYARASDFISDLHATLDAKGLYLDGTEEELAAVVFNLTLQLMERIRNEKSLGRSWV